jgi:hypothetical protein
MSKLRGETMPYREAERWRERKARKYFVGGQGGDETVLARGGEKGRIA